MIRSNAFRSATFEKQSPNARVVRIAGASHYIWRSNEAQVEREMNSFVDGYTEQGSFQAAPARSQPVYPSETRAPP